MATVAISVKMGKCVSRPTESELIEDTDTHLSIHCDDSMDWDDEGLMRHKSDINCLHNYAIGKMIIGEESEEKPL